MPVSNGVTSRWKEAFGNEECPTLYTTEDSQGQEFAPLNSPQKFLQDHEQLSRQQLYAIAENCQRVLKLAQDEYLHIEKLVRRLEGKNAIKNPQALVDPDQFEEEKESVLYGYKRVPRGQPYTRAKAGSDYIGFQEPFSQGGFVPTELQYRRKRAKADDKNNIDGWKPVERDGRKLIPRRPHSPPAQQRGFTAKASSPAPRKRQHDEANGVSDTDVTVTDTNASESDVHATPNRRGTRFLGQKIPPTRETSEAPPSIRGSPTPRGRPRSVKPNHALESKVKVKSGLQSTHIAVTSASSSPNSLGKRKRANGTGDAEDLPIITITEDSEASKKTKIMSKTVPRAERAERIVIENPAYVEQDRMLQPLSQQPDGDKKWTASSLIEAIWRDHSFLHPDPQTALKWKAAIMSAHNPVRTYAMKRKWAWWKKGGMDKRPRKGVREVDGSNGRKLSGGHDGKSPVDGKNDDGGSGTLWSSRRPRTPHGRENGHTREEKVGIKAREMNDGEQNKEENEVDEDVKLGKGLAHSQPFQASQSSGVDDATGRNTRAAATRASSAGHTGSTDKPTRRENSSSQSSSNSTLADPSYTQPEVEDALSPNAAINCPKSKANSKPNNRATSTVTSTPRKSRRCKPKQDQQEEKQQQQQQQQSQMQKIQSQKDHEFTFRIDRTVTPS